MRRHNLSFFSILLFFCCIFPFLLFFESPHKDALEGDFFVRPKAKKNGKREKGKRNHYWSLFFKMEMRNKGKRTQQFHYWCVNLALMSTFPLLFSLVLLFHKVSNSFLRPSGKNFLLFLLLN